MKRDTGQTTQAKRGPEDQEQGQAHRAGTRSQRPDSERAERPWIPAQSPNDGHCADEAAEG